MPSLGADMEAGTLVEWLVKPGDRVKRGDIVAVVETQKGAIEIEIFETGRIDQILVGLNSKVPVGTPLAQIRTEEEREAAIAPAPPAAAAKQPPVPPVMPVVPPPAPIAPLPLAAAGPPAVSRRLRASPAARRLAERRGIELAAIKGSGPGGAITYADVERQLARRLHPPAPA